MLPDRYVQVFSATSIFPPTAGGSVEPPSQRCMSWFMSKIYQVGIKKYYNEYLTKLKLIKNVSVIKRESSEYLDVDKAYWLNCSVSMFSGRHMNQKRMVKVTFSQLIFIRLKNVHLLLINGWLYSENSLTVKW